MDVAIYLFDGLTALDAVGPYEVLHRLPEARVRMVGDAVGPVRTGDGSLALHCDVARADVERADLLLVPGGWGTRALERDADLLAWLRAVDATTRSTLSVCTGAMLLAAAGLLRGRGATTHWASLERLREYGAEPRRERVVVDGKYVTGAGVAAGIDLALRYAADTFDDEVAQTIQLGIEYDPDPPFDCGAPHKAPPALVRTIEERFAAHE